ncbi:MAG: hypothetical protein KME06_04435 [Kastovskya adunca ATA6-11-RM4]|nr:hypothetical protein [Kastovskya adunca ATA6-11-RM4]
MPNHDSHAGHQMDNAATPHKTETAQAKLTLPQTIAPNQSVPLVIDVQGSNGKAIANFDTFQEQLMHLIVVSDDLQHFSHLHPEFKGNGRFEINADFPQPGNYNLFADYKPAGQKEQVSLLKATVPGKLSTPFPTDLNRTKTFSDTKATLSLSNPTIKAGEEVTLQFNLQDAKTNQPLTNLQPYLGEKGHLVILRQSSPIIQENYIHAHALGKSRVGEVSFHTSFPQPGKYKLWGQFNRGGKIVTTDFWVEVK